VVLIQVTLPTPNELPKLESQVSDIVARINGHYGSLEFTPVRHYHQNIDNDEYLALMRVADAALVTSLREGMNTMSLEYVICQSEKKSPLILSEFTGSAGSMSAALLVNPWDLTVKAASHSLG
jgi:trehalose-6-phosphate synthase